MPSGSATDVCRIVERDFAAAWWLIAEAGGSQLHDSGELRWFPRILTVLVRSSWDHRSMTVSINNLTVDCRDPRALADFWTAALGWVVVDESDEGVMIAPFSERHAGVFPVYFQENPDDKVVKNRWHFDLAPVDQEAEVTRLKALGARDADIGQGDVPWVVMADVEGNEFCVLRSLPKEAAG